MKRLLRTPDEVGALIKAGTPLLLAADEALLRALPPGPWIGGTIHYFMGDDGGTVSESLIAVSELPGTALDVEVVHYSAENLSSVYSDLPDNGFGAIIIPASSKAHMAFALEGPAFPDFGSAPLIGWVSGVRLADIDKVKPKVFVGSGDKVYDDGAAVLRVRLPAGSFAEPGIVNMFEPGDGDVLVFPETGFIASEVSVNGTPTRFADYVRSRGLDTRLPLVADYFGSHINVSFQSVDDHEVHFYAPVIKGVEYRHARPVVDYVAEFTNRVPDDDGAVVFSCNCILNFLHSGLEGKKTGHIFGPATFGEIAYQLLNQTLVHLSVRKAG